MPTLWKRAMVYLGLADDEEYGDYADYDEQESRGMPESPSPARGYSPGPPPATFQNPEPGTVRMLGRDQPAHPGPYPSQPDPPMPVPAYSGSSAVKTLPPTQPAARLHVCTPADFNAGAKEVGDRFKAKAPVIMVLTNADRQMARRLLDFASGLTYGLSGQIKPLSEGVFLLTPAGVEVSAEEKRRLRETGILFDDAAER